MTASIVGNTLADCVRPVVTELTDANAYECEPCLARGLVSAAPAVMPGVVTPRAATVPELYLCHSGCTVTVT